MNSQKSSLCIIFLIGAIVLGGCSNPPPTTKSNLEIVNQSSAKIGTIAIIIDGGSRGHSIYAQNADNSLLAKGESVGFDLEDTERAGVLTVELYPGTGGTETTGNPFARQVITWSIPKLGGGKLTLHIVDKGNSVIIVP